jgi:hypothetical protein
VVALRPGEPVRRRQATPHGVDPGGATGTARKDRERVKLLFGPYKAPRLREEQVLLWADAHHARTGRWPTRKSGPVREAPGENWSAVICALWAGYRGLPGGDTLRRLLRRHGRGRQSGVRPPA